MRNGDCNASLKRNPTRRFTMSAFVRPKRSNALAAAFAGALALAAVPFSTPAAAEEKTYETVDAALKAANAAHESVLVDFSGLWCHACWWMKANVMNGPQ